MKPLDTATEILGDLLRASFVIEAARAAVYRGWSAFDPSFGGRAEIASGRADVVAEALAVAGTKPDDDLIEPHADWIRSLIGDHPEEVPLGAVFLTRIGDWVEGHTSAFLGTGAERIKELGEAERAELQFPSSMPGPPGFEPVATIEAEPPGEVLFRFGILADMHIGSAAGEKRVRSAIEDLNRSGAELVFQLGDITDHGERAEFDLALQVLAKLEMPVTTIMGNHDVYSMKEARLSGREYYGTAFGRPPDGAIVEHKGFRFAVLDSIEHAASPFGPYDLVAGRFVDEGDGGAIVRGSLSAPQHELLADIAAPGGGPAFVFLHHPPQPFTGFPPVLFGLRDADSGRLHAVADSGNVWGVFAGHTHRNARTRTYGTVPAQEVAIPRDYPFGYALVDVTKDGYAYRFVQLSDEALLRPAYGAASVIHRRYGLGTEESRGFVWTKPGP